MASQGPVWVKHTLNDLKYYYFSMELYTKSKYSRKISFRINGRVENVSIEFPKRNKRAIANMV